MSGVVEVGFGMVMAGISRYVFVKWIVGVVVSLITGIVCSGMESVGLCTVYNSSVGDTFSEEKNVLSVPFIFVIGVLDSGRGCLCDLGVSFFSVGYLDVLNFSARDKSGGCEGGGVFFASSVSSFVISTMAVS